MQLIECIPNFSEGRNLAIIDQIVQAIASTPGTYLLHKDISHSVNRTVITVAGEPLAVIEAVFNAISCASELIDMCTYQGTHPHIGATDVCPIIPLAGVTMAQCVDLSKQLAARVGDVLKIPVYLYGQSARSPERQNLSYLRKGLYENLASRMRQGDFKPDFGPHEFNAKSGATVIGAESFYIAFNVNLNTSDLQIAKTIAQTIRKQREDYRHGLLKLPEKIKFTWQNCEAIGWFVEEYHCCQISMNLLNYKKTSLHEAYMGVNDLAREYGIDVTGGEIIGMVPLAAMLEAGQFALKKDGKGVEFSENEQSLVQAAITFLNLNQFQPFKEKEKY